MHWTIQHRGIIVYKMGNLLRFVLDISYLRTSLGKFGVNLCIYVFIFERGEEKEKERKRNVDVREKYRSAASWHEPQPTIEPTCNPGTCPDWESDWWPFTLQEDAQRTEPYHSGQMLSQFKPIKKKRISDAYPRLIPIRKHVQKVFSHIATYFYCKK